MTWKEFAADPRYRGGILESVEADGIFLSVIREIQSYHHDLCITFALGRMFQREGAEYRERTDLNHEFTVATAPFGPPIDTRGPKPVFAPPPPELVALADGRVLIVPHSSVLPKVSMLIVYPAGMREEDLPLAA